MADYFSWTNLFYFIGLIIAGLATIMATKYKAMMKEQIDDMRKLLMK